MKKMLAALIVTLAALASLSFAGTPNTKTYKINLTSAAKLAGNQLAAGAYTLAVNTESVRIVEVKTGQSFEVAAKIETSEKKFDATAITSHKVDGAAEISEIRLGGTRIQVMFR
jgi:hypothetical protein